MQEKIPTMLSMREAAKKSELSYYAIRKLVAEGLVPSLRIGKKVYVNFDALTHMMQTGERHDGKRTDSLSRAAL